MALSLLVASPAAFAAPPDQTTSAQQDQNKGKKAAADQPSRHKSDKGDNANAGPATGNNADVNRNVDVKRKVNVDRNVDVNRNVNVDRNVSVDRNLRGGRHIDLKVYRRSLHSARRYHWHVYRQPPGWYAHRWVYGERLPRAWFVRDYWIPDFIMFGLMEPPDGYVWVRVGGDALLVDVDTGEVVRVVYDVFY
jgi:Ni/Co efflux regulator RcnB